MDAYVEIHRTSLAINGVCGNLAILCAIFIKDSRARTFLWLSATSTIGSVILSAGALTLATAFQSRLARSANPVAEMSLNRRISRSIGLLTAVSALGTWVSLGFIGFAATETVAKPIAAAYLITCASAFPLAFILVVAMLRSYRHAAGPASTWEAK